MKKITLVATAFMMVLAACTKPIDPTVDPTVDPTPNHELVYIELTDAEKQLVCSNNDFVFNFFRAAQSNESQFFSPLSITYALSMLNNGATGQTQQEIDTVLGFGDTGTAAANDFCKKLLTNVTLLDTTTKMLIANTIFVNSGQGYELKPSFVQKANEYYNAKAESRDFNDGQTLDVINQWVNDHTDHLIPKILDEYSFNSEEISYLINAISFKGDWVNKFNKEETQDEPFNNSGMVPMMHQKNDFFYADNDTYQSIELPYGEGYYNYRMTVMLPHEGKTTDDILNQLNGQSWNDNLAQMHTYEVDLKLPRFETESNLELNDIMSGLGMPTAFDKDLAQFDEFCNVPSYIDDMKHVARIKLDEDGTEAAGITVICAGASMDPLYAEFHADHDFIYVISERETGAIFFIGKYMGR